MQTYKDTYRDTNRCRKPKGILGPACRTWSTRLAGENRENCTLVMQCFSMNRFHHNNTAQHSKGSIEMQRGIYLWDDIVSMTSSLAELTHLVCIEFYKGRSQFTRTQLAHIRPSTRITWKQSGKYKDPNHRRCNSEVRHQTALDRNYTLQISGVFKDHVLYNWSSYLLK